MYDLVRLVRPMTLNSGRVVERGLRRLGLTVGRRAVLEVLVEGGPSPVPEIARRLDLSRQAAQRLVNELAGPRARRVHRQPTAPALAAHQPDGGGVLGVRGGPHGRARRSSRPSRRRYPSTSCAPHRRDARPWRATSATTPFTPSLTHMERTTMDDSRQVFAATTANRRVVADVLDGLSPPQWEAATLCAGWDVHTVAAHLLQPMLVRFGRFFVTALRFRGDTDRVVDHVTRRLARHSRSDIVALLRSHAADEVSPPRVGPMGSFAETCIHLRDIARPLGLDVDVPAAHWEQLLRYLVSPSAAAALVTPTPARGSAARGDGLGLVRRRRRGHAWSPRGSGDGRHRPWRGAGRAHRSGCGDLAGAARLGRGSLSGAPATRIFASDLAALSATRRASGPPSHLRLARPARKPARDGAG